MKLNLTVHLEELGELVFDMDVPEKVAEKIRTGKSVLRSIRRCIDVVDEELKKRGIQG